MANAPYEKPVCEDVSCKVAEEFGEDHIMNKVAKCESRFRQYNTDGSVLRGEVNPKDVGIFQINERFHLKDSKRMGINIYTESGNIEYARILYEDQGLKPWTASKGCWSK